MSGQRGAEATGLQHESLFDERTVFKRPFRTTNRTQAQAQWDRLRRKLGTLEVRVVLMSAHSAAH